MNSNSDPRNYWIENKEKLAEAYGQSIGVVRIELVSRALRERLPHPARILDIGGGSALQAVSLATYGHEVTVIDVDAAMLSKAEGLLQTESAQVRSRINLIHGRGEDAEELVHDSFDAVTCDSVLMYLSDPEPLVRAMVATAVRGGILSIVSVNPDAWAMRSGLQGRWREAIEKISNNIYSNEIYLQNERHPRSKIEALLTQYGADIEKWYGVGVFTDHATEPIVAVHPGDVIEAEWLAGSISPYREVARCYHVIARKT